MKVLLGSRTQTLKKCEDLEEVYSRDVDGPQLYEEVLDCRMLL